MSISTTKMTAAQFLELGEDPAGIRLELVDGEVAVNPSPNPSHSYTDRMLTFILAGHIRKHDLGQLFGDVDTIFGYADVRRPDLIYLAKNRLHLVGDNAMEGPPDLCVEILSLSSRIIDRRDKFKQYAKGKVAHYWIVDPLERTVEAFRLSGRGYRPAGGGKGNDVLTLPPFPDLNIPLGELWLPKRKLR